MATAEEIKAELEKVAREAQAFRKQVEGALNWLAGQASPTDDEAIDALYRLGEVFGYVQAMRAVLFPDEEE